MYFLKLFLLVYKSSKENKEVRFLVAFKVLQLQATQRRRLEIKAEK